MVTSYLGSRVVVLDIGEAVRLAYRSLPYLEVDYDDVFGMDEGSLRGYRHVSLVDPRNTAARRREARKMQLPQQSKVMIFDLLGKQRQERRPVLDDARRHA